MRPREKALGLLRTGKLDRLCAAVRRPVFTGGRCYVGGITPSRVKAGPVVACRRSLLAKPSGLGDAAHSVL